MATLQGPQPHRADLQQAQADAPHRNPLRQNRFVIHELPQPRRLKTLDQFSYQRDLSSHTIDHTLVLSVFASLAIFAAIACMFAIRSASPAVIMVGVAIWGVTFGNAVTLLQTVLADAAGEDADVALSMNNVVWNK